MTAEPHGKTLSHFAWYTDYAEPAAEIIMAKVWAVAKRLSKQDVAWVHQHDLEFVVALLGAKEDWDRPADVLALAEMFDPATFDFSKLGLSAAVTERFVALGRAARRAVPA
jgi:hypothetical protein